MREFWSVSVWLPERGSVLPVEMPSTAGDRVVDAEVRVEARADAITLAIALDVLHVEAFVAITQVAGERQARLFLRDHVGGLVGSRLGFVDGLLRLRL